MYPIVIGITYRPPISQYGRALNRVTQEAQREAAEYWHREILPRHFQPGASETYGYAPRTEKYKRRKRRKPPLVFSGAGREDILGPPYIQSSPAGVRIRLAAPSYFWARPPANQPDKAAEVSCLTFHEQQKLMMRMGDNAARMLREMRRTETVIITGG